jgi:hypothetical protein
MPTDLAVARDKRYSKLTEPVYIVGREWCFEWFKTEIDTVIDLYNRGYGLTIIARRVDSTPRDTFLLLLDLAEQGRVKRRPGYLWGAM